MPLRFLSRLHSCGFTMESLSYAHYIAAITLLSSFNLCALTLLLSACFIFFPYTGLHKFKWTSLALQAESRVDKVRFHPVSSPLCVYVCVSVRTACISCGCCLVVGSCWVSPVHQSMSLQWVRATLPPFTFSPHPSFQPIVLLPSQFSNSLLPLFISDSSVGPKLEQCPRECCPLEAQMIEIAALITSLKTYEQNLYWSFLILMWGWNEFFISYGREISKTWIWYPIGITIVWIPFNYLVIISVWEDYGKQMTLSFTDNDHQGHRLEIRY